MLQNYLKIAFRNLVKNKVYSFINIAGLAVGMAVAMLIGLWIIDELSANKHHKNFNTLYQIMMHQTFDGHRGSQTALPYPMGEELRTKYPDFKAVAMCDWGSGHSLVVGNQKFSKVGHFLGEQGIDMFSLNVLKGNKNPLKDPTSIVLTEELATTLFGNQDPIGKVLKLDNTIDLKVTAIVAKQPKNATLQFDYLLPWLLQEKMNPDIKNNTWGNNSFQVFVQLKDGVNPEKTNATIKDVVLGHFKDNKLMQNNIKPSVFIHPMAKWRLYGEFEDGVNVGGFIKYVKLFGIFGLIVLLIACINFMNLSTARSEKRAKEVGVRKAMGSGREQLIGQFLSESLVISFIALALALILVELALPSFNKLTEKDVSLQLSNPLFWGIMLVFTVFTGLLAGSYPALYLSSFNPVRVLKGTIRVGKSASLPRQVLVVLQFSFSIALMIGTVIIYQQIQYGKNRPIGFDSKGLISVFSSADLVKNYNPLRNELLASGAISSICKSSSPPYQTWSNNDGWKWKGSQPEDNAAIFQTIATSYDYIKTVGIKLKAGRDFSTDFASDSSGVILNEAAVKRMGLKNPVGELLKWQGKQRKVVGVVPNMQMDSPFEDIRPTTIVFEKDWVNVLCIRMNPNVSASEAIKKMAPIFDKYNPGFPFDYQFTDEQYAKKFDYLELIGNLSLVVAFLAIFISCLGLFGLASFMAEQRTKEIGVRKVLGATVINITTLLSKDFLKLVIISILIASPIAYFTMKNWLQDYEYRMEIGAGVFVLVMVVAILIALSTVSYQAIKAGLANPVKSLRTE
ncbi:MAG: ABC transporter permease [Bacteroidota bacterium]